MAGAMSAKAQSYFYTLTPNPTNSYLTENGSSTVITYSLHNSIGSVGDIWVYSEPGKGTTFKLYFPRVDDQLEDSASSEAELPKALSSETILVVEDEKAVRDLTVKILQRMGYTLLTAATGAEAVEISRAHRGQIALLLTDVVMPHMSGRQLADTLLPARPGMKVLYLSGYTENTVVHHGVLDSNVDFLSKPFSRETLARKVHEILSRGASIQS